MFENNIIQITTAKLVGATLLPNSILLISGVIVWRYWRNKQTQLQTKTNTLNNEIQQIKKQIADIQVFPHHTSQKDTPKENTHTDDKMGLFEVLIQDNIRLRQ